jgi:hypothetical protein
MTQNVIRTVPRTYRGQNFRSTLEARWAIFFDEMGIEWVYEPEGYIVNNEEWYVPDFYLPQFKTWAEVKGVFGDAELRTAINALDYGVLPETREGDGTTRGLLYLGNIPKSKANDNFLAHQHIMFVHNKGVTYQKIKFSVNLKGKPELLVEPLFGQQYFDSGISEKCPDWLGEAVIQGMREPHLAKQRVATAYKSATNYKFF